MKLRKRVVLLSIITAIALCFVGCNVDKNVTLDSSSGGDEPQTDVGKNNISEEFINESNDQSKIETEEIIYEKVNNPFLESAADPNIACYKGKYYYCFPGEGGICISSFDSLGEATYKGAVRVWEAPRNTMYSEEIWAPELHRIDDAWYIYFAASDGDNDNHRMFVLKCEDEDPLTGFEFVGQVTDEKDKWAIDGTIFEYRDELYFCWSGWPGDENGVQRIYIARMSSPTEISSKRVWISTPILEWETKGGSPLVNEGPCAIVDGDYLTILYSASGSWCDDYCIGQLIFQGGDILDEDCWFKNPTPILSKDCGLFYGPGHCSVVPDENENLWIVFHANLKPGTGWSGRSGWMYPIKINEDGVVEVILYEND